MLIKGLAALLAARLSDVPANFSGSFTRSTVVDDLLPNERAYAIAGAFRCESKGFTRLESFRERKSTSNRFDVLPSLLGDITFALRAPEVVTEVERITGVQDLIADPTSYAGGVSDMKRGDFLNPHVDNSHNGARTHYRRLNLLYYPNPDWQPGDGGELELWDSRVRTARCIQPRFNRLVLMETNRSSWHSVAPVVRGRRHCVSSYYFSNRSHDGRDYYRVTSFMGRPNQPAHRVFAAIDNGARQLARALGATRETDRGFEIA